jgi:hypothetical protein
MCSSNTPETERGVIPVVVVVGRGGYQDHVTADPTR